MNTDDVILSLLPQSLRPLYGKGFDKKETDKCTDLITYTYRVPVLTGRIPPVSLAFETVESPEVPVVFIIGDSLTVYGVDVTVKDYENDRHPGFGPNDFINVWTVYVDEVAP